MARSRLSTAIDSGDLILPEGPVRVLRPPEEYDLSTLDPERVEIAHGLRPLRDAWLGRGYAAAGAGEVPTVLVVMPRSKSLARVMVLEALEQATGLVIVDGQKTDGVDSLFKACKTWAQINGTVTKAHGRLFWFAPDDRPDWELPEQRVERFITAPGVFSEDKVDRGSALLAEALPPLKGRVADLGAGWGYLSDAILQSTEVNHLDMVEAEKLAVDCLTRNITDARAMAHWADATTFRAEEPYDAVVMNPPFHTGRKGVPDLGRAFITSAAQMLKPRGSLFMVANRHLPYEDILNERFGQVTELGGDGGFKLITATRPKR